MFSFFKLVCVFLCSYSSHCVLSMSCQSGYMYISCHDWIDASICFAHACFALNDTSTVFHCVDLLCVPSNFSSGSPWNEWKNETKPWTSVNFNFIWPYFSLTVTGWNTYLDFYLIIEWTVCANQILSTICKMNLKLYSKNKHWHTDVGKRNQNVRI